MYSIISYFLAPFGFLSTSATGSGAGFGGAGWKGENRI